MSNGFNIGDLGRLAQEVLDQKYSGQEYMLNDVYNVVRQAYEKYPEDSVINQVAFAIEKMASKAPSGTTINQASISKIYNEFVRLSDNSKFRDVLGFLLLGEDKKTEVASNLVASNRDSNTPIKNSDLVDTELVNSFSSQLGRKASTILDADMVKRGTNFIKAELQSIGFNGQSVEVLGGDTGFILYSVGFDTNKGKVSIAVPVEVRDGKMLFPNSFMVQDKLFSLNESNLNDFLKQEPTKVPIEKPELDIKPNVTMPTELAHLTRDFENDVIEAASAFGLNTIRNGKELVARELSAAGFKGAQVKFGSESNNSVIYLASINTPKGKTEIEVPLEIKRAGDKYVPLAPSYFAYDGIIEDFTPVKLQRFAINIPGPSTKNTVYSSAFAYMTLPELKDEILKALASDDYVTCETIISEIQDKFSEEDIKNVVADYHYYLMHKTGMEKEQSERHCSREIPAGKGSIHRRCGHYLVTMDKVVVGEDGNCRLKTSIERERLNKPEDGGAAMNTSKILMT